MPNFKFIKGAPLIVILIGLFILFISVRDLIRGQESLKWPYAKAQVRDSMGYDTGTVKYFYTVNGVQYRSSSIAFLGAGIVPIDFPPPDPGTEISIAYNPNNPTESVMFKGPSLEAWVSLAIVPFIFLAAHLWTWEKFQDSSSRLASGPYSVPEPCMKKLKQSDLQVTRLNLSGYPGAISISPYNANTTYADALLVTIGLKVMPKATRRVPTLYLFYDYDSWIATDQDPFINDKDHSNYSYAFPTVEEATDGIIDYYAKQKQ